MSNSFIKRENRSREHGAFALNIRLFGSLKWLMRLLPLSLVAILLSSAAPSFFRWYSGLLSAGTPAAASGWIRVTPTGLAIVAACGILFRIAAWALFEVSGMWSAQKIHADMVRALARTRTTFFDENPSGRMINRLIRDFDEVRLTAIIFVGDLLNAIVEVLSIAAVAALASPWAVVAVLPLLVSFSWIQSHRSAMLDHSRSLAAEATSQVLGRKTDLIEGREIFLLYGHGGALLDRMAASFRSFVHASSYTFQIETWGSFWIRVSAECFSFIALILTVFALQNGRIDAAIAGVVISALFGITGSVGWLDFATGMVSRSLPHVRRVFEYVDLPREEAEEGHPVVHSEVAAGSGDLIFTKYSMSYRADTPVILGDLDLRLVQGSKTALIGRTGSGKTSLAQALLRMVHVRNGDIRIGNRSAFEIELRDYRRLFGVVPQSPYLFEGTLRSNLDRLGEFNDEVLRRALSVVGLELSLEHLIAEGGLNLSVGERQLVCLARVIAADRPYILMDEPTSGLDPITDARISEVLRTALLGRTVLTIAHRPESLSHYDRIIELSAGKVIWQGSFSERSFSRKDLEA